MTVRRRVRVLRAVGRRCRRRLRRQLLIGTMLLGGRSRSHRVLHRVLARLHRVAAYAVDADAHHPGGGDGGRIDPVVCHLTAVLLAPVALDRVALHLAVVGALDGAGRRLLRDELDERVALVLEHPHVVDRPELAKVRLDQVVRDGVRREAAAVHGRVGRAGVVVDLLEAGRLAALDTYRIKGQTRNFK